MPKPRPSAPPPKARKKPGPKSQGKRENRNISGLASIFEKFDAYCAEHGISLSTFLSMAGQEKMARDRKSESDA